MAQYRVQKNRNSANIVWVASEGKNYSVNVCSDNTLISLIGYTKNKTETNKRREQASADLKYIEKKLLNEY